MKRIFLDMLLLAIFLLTMSFQFLPQILHEGLGILMLALTILHLIWNRQWFRVLIKGKWNVRRAASFFVIFLLTAALLLTIVTGMMISNHLFKGVFGLYLQRNMLVHQLHVSLPYGLLILTGLHLGFHWAALWQRFMAWRHWKGKSLLYKIWSKAMLLFFVLGGIYRSFMNQVGDHLQLKHLFATPATQTKFGFFVVMLLGIVGMYTAAGSIFQKMVKNNRKMSERV